MNKTFPCAAKSSPRRSGAGKGWRKVGLKIIWPNEMKMFLVGRVKEHISVLEGDQCIGAQQKTRVWEQIYKALIRRGMPDSDVRMVKKTWSGLRASTVEAYRRMETKRRNTRSTIEITELQRAIHEVIELSNKLKASGNSVMPMPMKIKVELLDNDIDDAIMANDDELNETDSADAMNQTQRAQQHLQLLANPVVVLQPLNIYEPASDGPTEAHVDPPSEEKPNESTPQIEPKTVPPSTAIQTPPLSMPTPPPSIEGASGSADHGRRPEHPPERDASPNCQRVYDQIAEAELKIKLLQQRKEEQALEFEREIFIRRLDVLNADLKKRNMEIDFLVRMHQNGTNNNSRAALE